MEDRKRDAKQTTSIKGPGPGPGGPGPGAVEKAKDFKGTMAKLWGYLKPYKLSIIMVVFFAAASSAFSIAGPNILRKATNKLVEGFIEKITGVPGGGIDFDYIGMILLIILVLYLASALFGFIQGYVITGVAQKVSYSFRKEISEKINKLPLKYFDNNSYGEVLSRVTNDIDTVSQSLNQSMSQIITSIVTIVGVLIMMITISWQMTLISILILPVSMFLIMAVVKKSQKYFKEQQKSLGETNGYVEEVYGGQNIVKAFNREDDSKREFKEMNDELYGSAWKSQFLSGMMMPIMNFVGNLGYVLVSISGGWFVVRNVIKIGDILAFIQYVRTFTQPIAQIAQMANLLQSTAAAAERVFEFLEEEDEVEEKDGRLDLDSVRGEVEFDHVSFGYEEGKTIINDFSVNVKPGQKVAIVGPTGAGKTTVVKLLMRFYELNEGTIKIDGRDINDFRRSDLRNAFGMVLQDTWLFNGSILENIRYGNLNTSDEEVMEAAKSAHADHFIRTLPNCYDMDINEEANNISQGQKQLLTIARAILSDPKILILDEATSSVDTRTEILIQKAMENLMKGRTSFIIAHRLSTIRDADLILVMKDGDIVEQGTHDELLRAKGFYESLYNSQFEISDAV